MSDCVNNVSFGISSKNRKQSLDYMQVEELNKIKILNPKESRREQVMRQH